MITVSLLSRPILVLQGGLNLALNMRLCRLGEEKFVPRLSLRGLAAPWVRRLNPLSSFALSGGRAVRVPGEHDADGRAAHAAERRGERAGELR
jgi:hypothetical protein